MAPRIVVSVSGGKDSTANVLLLYERQIPDVTLLFADTGAEFPETHETLHRLSEYTGYRLITVSQGNFQEHLIKFGYLLPGPRTRWCTRILKTEPLDTWMIQQGPDIVSHIGIRADETKRIRPNKKPWPVHYPLVNAGMGKQEVFALCEKHSMLNPVYKWRSSCSCFCCFFQRKSDWLGLLEHHPGLYSLANQWEKESMRNSIKGYTWKQGRTLEGLKPQPDAQLQLFA